MSVSPMFRSRERGPTRMRENAEQRAARIELGASGAALEPGSMAFAEGQQFTTAGRTITPAAIAFVEGPGSRYGDTAPAGLVLGYALGLVPLVDERIVAVRPRGDVSFGRAARVGDAIHIEGWIDEVKGLDDESDIVRMTCDVLNQRREQIGHIEVDALMDHGSRPGAACREQDYVKRESAAAVPA
jgi:hypothetical protein